MSTSIEAWAQSFQFSEDLQTLEQIYHEQHRESLVAASAVSSIPSEEPVDRPFAFLDDEAALDRLAIQISERLSGFLADPDVLSHYLKLQELTQDNRVMAQYIEELLNRVDRLENENRQLRRALL